MIKQIITTTTLIAAAAAMANAETELVIIDLATNGGTVVSGDYVTGTAKVNQTRVDSLSGVVAATVADSTYLVQGTGNIVFASNITQIRRENGNFADGIACSNTNMNVTGSWSFGPVTTSFTVADGFTLESLKLDSGVLRGDSAGSYRSALSTGKGNYTVVLSNGRDSVTWTAEQSYVQTGPVHVTTSFVATGITDYLTLAAGDTLSIAYSFVKTENFSDGGYISVQDITLLGTAAIPEPSMFGLLAGLGALALVGARRRRK